MSGRQIHTLLTFFFLLCIFTVEAQKKRVISGIVRDAFSQEYIAYANITFPDLGLGTSSNEKGEFTLNNIPAGRHKLAVTYIGYQEYNVDISFDKDESLIINLNKQSLGLKEVVVSAEHSSAGTTSSKITSEAIDHVQATSLREVMQLLPGNLSVNPNLAEPGKISIREVDANINSALGTAIIIDGIPLSNDGNMQQSIQGGFTSVAGSGVDLRQIPVENIESITVDVGIPSAEHGNLTSGAVHIKTKTGGSPYSAKLQTDPHAKQAYIGKGYLLNKNNGVINFDAGYTNSYEHISKKTDQFERINAAAKYRNTYFRESSPLNLEVKINYLGSIHGKKWDPDMKAQEENYGRNQQLQSKLSALWSLNKSFLKSISLDAAYFINWQEGYEKTLETVSSGANIIITSKTDGEHEAIYGPASYYSEVTYDGKPFNFYTKFKTRFYYSTDHSTQNILLGAEWRTSGNNGEGRIFNPERPPSGVGTRPRPFTDIPSLNQLSFFVEDKIDVDFGATNLLIMAGLRIDNIQPDGIFSSDGSLTFDPRLNLQYNLLDRNSNYLFRKFSVRVGYGKTSKSPTLVHLYPDKVYNDVVNFNYYPDLVVATTKVMNDTRNYDLKAARSSKFEAGLDFQIGKVNSRITGFYEKHEGGFIADKNHFLLTYKNYQEIDAGLAPYFIDGQGVYYNSLQTGEAVAVSYEMYHKYKDYPTYRNAATLIKRGVEYSIDFGQIDAVRTSFELMGAWLQTESYTTSAPYSERKFHTTYVDNKSVQESFVVKFPNKNGYGIVDERLNTNLNITTHIPELKLLVTVTTQAIWFEKNRRKLYAEYKLYTLNELREHLNQPNLFSQDNENDNYYYLPESYRGYDGVEHEYDITDFETALAQLAIKKDQKYRYKTRTLPPLFLCNIKISKDIARRIKLSFYANNFLNIRPWELDQRSGRYIRRNNPPYFGADIKLLF
ncbi:MAG TPA: TonB-dependent receptor [Draconibacterium sp.]|nr:TonB-dependent receptor [Draconibacterium sp.]